MTIFYLLSVVGGAEVPFKVNVYDGSVLSVERKSQIALAVYILIWIIAEYGKYFQVSSYILQVVIIVARMIMAMILFIVVQWFTMIRYILCDKKVTFSK